MKIGIYTIHAAYNYGAMFQAYGTQKAIESLGYETELVNYYPIELEKKYENRIFSLKPKAFLTYLYARINPKARLKFKRFKAFHEEMHLSKRYYSLNEIYSLPPKYDIHLVGSDQVWNIEQGLSSKPFYFLDFLKSNEKKISYASSFGTSEIDEKHNEKLKELLSSFEAIAVRENEGVEIIRKATSLKATQVMDPTFLIDGNDWASLTSEERIIKEDYIFCYGFDGSAKSEKMLKTIRERLGLPLVVVSISLFFPFKVDKFIQEAGPKEFLNLAKNASFVCSSSYHGIAFAIHFKKSFVSTKHPTRNSRMNTMLSKLGLSDRQFDDPNDILNMSDEELYIDYNKFEGIINKAKKESLDWLESSLKSNKNE